MELSLRTSIFDVYLTIAAASQSPCGIWKATFFCFAVDWRTYEAWLKSFEANPDLGQIVWWELTGIISNQMKPRMPNFSVRSSLVLDLEAKIWDNKWGRWTFQSWKPKFLLTFQSLKQMPKSKTAGSNCCRIQMGGNSSSQSPILARVSTLGHGTEFWPPASGALVTSILVSDFGQ